MRFLRHYESIARKEHFCNCCCKYIMPGEKYEGSVYVTKNNGIIVSKQHVNPGCDFPSPEELFLGQLKSLESFLEKDGLFDFAA